jgi:hypothetical protein
MDEGTSLTSFFMVAEKLRKQDCGKEELLVENLSKGMSIPLI